MGNYIVAANKSWHKELYDAKSPGFPGQWTYVDDHRLLTPALVAEKSPRYIFFPHWSQMVPEAVLIAAECVCFHMTDVPYGRGGSPLQNLIVRKHKKTKLTALKMTEEIDAGPVYCKRELSLDGSAEQIYRRCAELTWEIISFLVSEEPEPVPQSGEVVNFRRRDRSEGEMSGLSHTDDVYDYIRMLDAEGYPPAFLEFGNLVYEFSQAENLGEEVRATVVIRKKKLSE